MAKKKPYSKPEITKIDLDPSFTMMQGSPPGNPGMMMPMGGGKKSTDNPFESPFDDKPFG
jgi:hypothetical protein